MEDLSGSNAALIAVIVILARLIEALVKGVYSKLGKNDIVAELEHKEERDTLLETHRLVQQLDITQKQVIESVGQISRTQETMSDVLSRTVKLIDRVDRRQEIFFSQIKADKEGAPDERF